MAKLQIYLSPPTEFLNSDTCFRYSQLLIVEIGKAGKVSGYTLNDFAPAWLKKDIETRRQNGQINFKRLDSVVVRSGIKNCKLVFPLTLESDNFPCTKIEAPRYVETDFYTINGRSLSGNIIFMEPLVFMWGTNFRY